jgi:predicted Zn finger-like uncharacterized protein
MRLTCPACQSGVTVPDAESGKEVTCPSCKATFTAPELMTTYSVSDTSELFPQPPKPEPKPEPVAEPALEVRPDPAAATASPPPLPMPEAGEPAREGPPELPKPAAKLPGEYERLFSFGIQHRVVVWVPAVCMTLAFFLTFFNWVGLFPGGRTAYSQNAWQAMAANFSSDPVCEQVLKMESTINAQIRTSWFLVLYLFALFPAVVLTWFGHVVTRYDLLKKMPYFVRDVWHLRTQVLVGLTAFTLALLLLQGWVGFGLTNGLKRGVEAEFAQRLEEAANNSVELEKVRVEMDVKLHNYHAETTFWLRLAYYAHLLAVLSIAVENWLVSRNGEPAPRVAVMW